MQKTKSINLDIEQRGSLIALQEKGEVEPSSRLPDPPLLELEKQSFHVFLGVLMNLAVDITDEAELGKVRFIFLFSRAWLDPFIYQISTKPFPTLGC